MKYTFIILLTHLTVACFAQDEAVSRPSPLAVVQARYKDAYFKLTYSRPQKKGREIFGSLVPFGQVWRTGANEATEITLTRDMKINGLELKAGTYSVFTIPDKETWTFIINSDQGLWGAYNYNPKSDVLRFSVSVAALADLVVDVFTMTLEQRNEKADLVILWDKTRVVVPLQFLEPKL